MALIDKPSTALGQNRDQSLPVVVAADLQQHREVPEVSARLARVEAAAAARAREDHKKQS